MVNFEELYNVVSEEKFRMIRVMENSVNHMQATERMKNVLFNKLDEIEQALDVAAKSTKSINLLELELADAEREISEKEAQIKELTAKKTTAKKKPAGAADE